MISEKVKSQIQVVQGDITKLDCDWMVPSTGQPGRNCWRSVVRCTAAAPEKQKSLRATG